MTHAENIEVEITDGLAPADQFKSTELGLLPSDWLVVSLESVADVTSGKRLPKGYSLTNKPTPHPYIRVADMRLGTVDLSDIRFVPLEVARKIGQYRIYRGELFISVAGTLGIIGTTPDELDGANLSENADRIANIQCSRRYLMHALMSSMIQNIIWNIRTVGAQPKLALTRIRKFPIALPPTQKEQAEIGQALDDADRDIEALERLIEKKRQIKQGTMQELLSGRSRLPGFSRKWDLVRLGERGHFFKGSGVRRDQAQSGELPCVRYGELYTHYDDVIWSFYSRISKHVARNATKVIRGDILFAGSGETKDEIGKCAVLDGAEYAYAGGDIIVFRLSRDDPKFLAYLLNFAPVQAQKSAKGQGDAVVHISSRALSDLELRLPHRDEQRAIAETLLDMGTELNALEARLEKARQIKQGMMQELLTGKVRLV